MRRIFDGTTSHLDAAALIWARATAARDGDAEIASLDEARPIIAGVLGASPRALLVVAEAGGQAVAFAAVAPVPGSEEIAELQYLGTDPSAWGTGAARELLAALPTLLRERGFGQARLCVYTDNERAVRLYEGMGWVPDGVPVPHHRTGKSEQRYMLALRVGSAITG